MTQLIDSSLAAQFEKLPPHDIGAEISVIASMMLDINAIDIVRSIINRDAFYQADHQVFFDVICNLHEKDSPIDAIIVREQLVKLNLFEEVGGFEYMRRILGTVPSAAHAEHYARIVRNKWILRQVISISNDALRDAYEASDDPMAVVCRFADKINAVQADGKTFEIVRIGEAVIEAYEQTESGGAPSIKTGIRDLDREMHGVVLGETIIVAAPPSSGKTTLATQIAVCGCKEAPIGFLSLEESRHKLSRRLLSMMSSIEVTKFRDGKLTADEWQSAAQGLAKCTPLDIFVADRSRRIEDIEVAAATLVRKYGCKLLIIDYLQRIVGDRRQSQYEQVSDNSARVSELFKRLGCGGLVLSSLNRELFKRENKRPMMSDLRASGEIEYNADIILGLHREDYWHLNDSGYTPNNQLEILFLKFREGGRGNAVILKTEMRFQRFQNSHIVGAGEHAPEPSVMEQETIW